MPKSLKKSGEPPANDNQTHQPLDRSLLWVIPLNAAVLLLVLRALADPWIR
jgi:hypothetical protein